MPLTTLDPKTALIVIDLQKGIVNGNFVHPIGEVIDRTRALIDVFRAKSLPVVLVNVAGRAPGRTEQGPRSNTSFSEGWTDLLPQLDQQPSDIVVTKRSCLYLLSQFRRPAIMRRFCNRCSVTQGYTQMRRGDRQCRD